MSSAKENILSRIRSGKDKAKLWEQVYEPEGDDFFVGTDTPLLETFSNALSKIDGQIFVANNNVELEDYLRALFSNRELICLDKNLQDLLSKNDIPYSDTIDLESNPLGFISCEYITARLGSVLTSSAINSGRQINIFPEHQVVFAHKTQLVYDIKDALEGLKLKYSTLPSMISFATGPSRTADIEKTLILGAHGPKMLTIIFQNFD